MKSSRIYIYIFLSNTQTFQAVIQFVDMLTKWGLSCNCLLSGSLTQSAILIKCGQS